jgi:hypothetical protein
MPKSTACVICGKSLCEHLQTFDGLHVSPVAVTDSVEYSTYWPSMEFLESEARLRELQEDLYRQQFQQEPMPRICVGEWVQHHMRDDIHYRIVEFVDGGALVEDELGDRRIITKYRTLNEG